jgi:hypothetical protein
MRRMISASLHTVAELVIRRAQRQGYVNPREVCEVLADNGLSESLWKDVVALGRHSLSYRRGRYYYQAPVSDRVAREQFLQRAIQKAIRQLIRHHRAAHSQVERRGHHRIDFVQPVRVIAEDGQEFTLFTRDLSATGIRLIGTRRLLGQKVRVLIPNPGQGEPWEFTVRVLWTCAVGGDLVENGGAFVEMAGPAGR